MEVIHFMARRQATFLLKPLFASSWGYPSNDFIRMNCQLFLNHLQKDTFIEIAALNDSL